MNEQTIWESQSNLALKHLCCTFILCNNSLIITAVLFMRLRPRIHPRVSHINIHLSVKVGEWNPPVGIRKASEYSNIPKINKSENYKNKQERQLQD